MLKDPSGSTETTILVLLPSTDVEVKGNKYTGYLEEKVTTRDRCFAYTSENNPEEIFLFQITDSAENINMPRGNLELINIKNEEHMFVLVATGVGIVKSIEGEANHLSKLRRHINIGKNRYTVTYQSPNVEIVGEPLHNQYEKRVRSRLSEI